MTDMNDVQLRRLDAGLLLVFERIWRTGNLTRAGEALGLTPSAVSHALSRLRDIFGDPLFLRRAQGVEPTPRAAALREPVQRALAALRGALSEGDAFRPEAIDRLFQIVALDAMIASLAPPLLTVLAREAPKARVAFRSLGRKAEREAVLEGQADLALGVFGPPGPGLVTTPIGVDSFAVVARAGHPGIEGALTLDAWLAYDHIVVSAAGDIVGAVDDALAARGLARRTRYAIPQFLATLATVAASDATATVPLSLANDFARAFKLRIHEPPIELAPFELSILRKRAEAPDPALDWLTDRISEIRAATAQSGHPGGASGEGASKARKLEKRSAAARKAR